MSERAEGRERRFRGRTKAERRAERREALLAAALELFGTQGYGVTTIEEICRTAYVSTRSFYEEYANREELTLDLYDRAVGRLASAVQATTVEPGDQHMARLTRAQVGAFVHTATDDPRVGRFALIQIVGISSTVEQRRRQAHRMFADFIATQAQAWVAEGELAPPPDAFAVVSVGMVGAVNEVVIDWLLRESDPDRPEVEQIVSQIHQMFQAFVRSV